MSPTDTPEWPPVVRLDPGSVEAIASRVVELLADSQPAAPDPRGRLLTAAQVAERWGVDRGWVYDNAGRLGALRLGDGARPRLRFDPARIADALGYEPRALVQAVSGHSGRRRRNPRPSRTSRLRGAELSSSKSGRPGGAQTPPAAAPKRTPSAR